jgi:hypothetical protein
MAGANMAGANRTARENSIDAASFDFAGLSHGDFVGGVSENTEANRSPASSISGNLSEGGG